MSAVFLTKVLWSRMPVWTHHRINPIHSMQRIVMFPNAVRLTCVRCYLRSSPWFLFTEIRKIPHSASWIKNERRGSISMSILWLDPQSSCAFIMQEQKSIWTLKRPLKSAVNTKPQNYEALRSTISTFLQICFVILIFWHPLFHYGAWHLLAGLPDFWCLWLFGLGPNIAYHSFWCKAGIDLTVTKYVLIATQEDFDKF